MACHSDPDRLARYGRVAPRNASATLALRTVSRRTHIPVPAIPIRAGAEQQLPELIHQEWYHIQFRLKRVLRAEALAVSGLAKKGAPRERGSVFRRNVERENRICGTIDNREGSSAMALMM